MTNLGSKKMQKRYEKKFYGVFTCFLNKKSYDKKSFVQYAQSHRLRKPAV